MPARQAKPKDVLGEFVIADDDAVPVFDPLKEVLDQMALPVAGLAERGRDLSIPARRNAGSDSTLGQPLAGDIAVVAFGSHHHRPR